MWPPFEITPLRSRFSVLGHLSVARLGIALLWTAFLPRLALSIAGEPEVTEWQFRFVWDLARFAAW